MLNAENHNSGDIVSRAGCFMSQFGSSFTVILKDLVSQDQAVALIALPNVESIILESPDESMARRYPGRIGWYDIGKSKFIFPLRMGKELVHIGFFSTLGFRATYRAWVGGMRVLHVLDPIEGHSQYRMLGMVARTFLSNILFRLGQTRAAPIIEYLRHLLLSRRISRLNTLKLGEYIFVPKRVALVSGSLGPGGSERQVLNTLLGLKDRGFSDVVLLHEKPMQPPHDFFLPQLGTSGVACHQLLDIETGDYREWRSLKLGELRKLLRTLGISEGLVLSYLVKFCQERPEVVHTWLDAVNVTAGLAAAIVGVPRVVIGCRSLAPHHFSFYQPYMKPVYRFLAKFPNVIILNNSKAGADDYEAWLGLSRGTIRVLRNGFDFKGVSTCEGVGPEKWDYLRQFGIPPNVQIVGTVMRLSEEKNPFLWIQMAELVCSQHEKVYFLIVGDGPLRGVLEKEVARIGLTSRVLFLGQREDVYQLLALMDIFVLTSRVEGLPNVIIEAQSLGIPVVATAVGGVEETFENGVTGFSVSEHIPSKVAEKVLMLLTEKDVVKGIRDRAPDMIRKRFSIDRMISETIDAYGLNDTLSSNCKCNTSSLEGLRCCHAKEIL